MSDYKPRHFPLDNTVGAEFFTRQKDGYSCGPACIASAANVYATGMSYDDVRKKLKPTNWGGTPQERMDSVSRDILPYAHSGQHVYNGGVAVACIDHGDEPHYVLLLCRENDEVIYYDPYEHELVIDRFEALIWEPGYGFTPNWTLNFKEVEGNTIQKWLAYVAPAPQLEKIAAAKKDDPKI